MSVKDRDVHVCTCNATMPLDGAALARALGRDAPLAGAHAMCQRELGGFADDRRTATRCRLHAGAAAARRRRPKTAARADRSASSTSARPPAGRREARAATPKIAALLAAAALPDPPPVPRVSYASQRRAADRRSGRRGARAGRTRCSDALAVTVLVTTADRRRRRCRRTRDYPVLHGPVDRAHRLARRVRGGVAAGQSDRSRPLHALQRVHRACPEDAIDLRYQVDLDRCRDHRACVARLRRRRRDRLRSRATPRARSASTSCSTCATHARSRSTSRRRATSRPAPTRAQALKPMAELAALVGEFEKPKLLRLQASRSARTAARARPAAPSASTCARPPPSRRRRRAFASSRICAWAAARARRSVLRAR